MNRPSAIMRRALLVSFVVLTACGSSESPAADVSEDELGTTYGSFIDTLQGEEQDAWIQARRKLRDGFERLCGSSVCAGDFSNLATVRLTCSTTRTQRKMKECVWVVAGNLDHVDAATGAHATDARAIPCAIPVAGTAARFLEAITRAGDDALLAPLPGTNGSFYDGLVACFAGVAASPAPQALVGDYVEIGRTMPPGWSDTQRKLAAAFDDACGNAFCEGDYSDITALRLACDVRQTDDHVGTCHWTFALADSDVDSRGHIRTRSATKTCAIPIDAPASALTKALAGDDAIRAPLPGQTTSLYDALIGCL